MFVLFLVCFLYDLFVGLVVGWGVFFDYVLRGNFVVVFGRYVFVVVWEYIGIFLIWIYVCNKEEYWVESWKVVYGIVFGWLVGGDIVEGCLCCEGVGVVDWRIEMELVCCSLWCKGVVEVLKCFLYFIYGCKVFVYVFSLLLR